VSELISPRQVARAIGVSESSLKRWCDRGLIETVRTAGGHRRISAANAIHFVRETGQSLVKPELLGLPPTGQGAPLALDRGRELLLQALLDGEEAVASRIFSDLYLSRHSLCSIFDQVVTSAFQEIGERWACQSIEVFHERRACEIAMRLLVGIRRFLPETDGKWVAIGGTAAGDLYTLPNMMAELVLEDCGFQARSLGNSIPFDSLVKAVMEIRPKLFWLSVSHIPDEAGFLAGFRLLESACNEIQTALVVGGRALVSALRQQMTYSCFCDTMQHLNAFAMTLQSPANATIGKRNVSGKSANGRPPSTKRDKT
jgi:MerR family transcriptional regulator, light-induced transcriptional regulator